MLSSAILSDLLDEVGVNGLITTLKLNNLKQKLLKMQKH